MMIIKRESLEKKIKECDLIPIEVNSVNVSNEIIINVKSIDDFLSVVKNLDSKYVYYKYIYYDKDDYIIPLDYYSEYPKDFKKVVNEHNAYIRSIDFEQSNKLTIFILLNGTFLGVDFDNDWLTEQGILDKDEQIEIIENDFQKEVKNIKEQSKKQKIDDTNILRNIILNDGDFKYKKNQDLRQSYLVDLLERDDMEKYTYLFIGYYNNLDRTLIKMFMDETWMIYQENKKTQ